MAPCTGLGASSRHRHTYLGRGSDRFMALLQTRQDRRGETQGLVTPHACDMTGCGSGSVRCHGIESVRSRACVDLGSVRSQQFGWVRVLPDPKSES
jgi:hypothetical protein